MTIGQALSVGLAGVWIGACVWGLAILVHALARRVLRAQVRRLIARDARDRDHTQRRQQLHALVTGTDRRRA